MDKWTLFFLWIVIAMIISNVGMWFLMRWYRQHIAKLSQQDQQKVTHKDEDILE